MQTIWKFKIVVLLSYPNSVEKTLPLLSKDLLYNIKIHFWAWITFPFISKYSNYIKWHSSDQYPVVMHMTSWKPDPGHREERTKVMMHLTRLYQYWSNFLHKSDYNLMYQCASYATQDLQYKNNFKNNVQKSERQEIKVCSIAWFTFNCWQFNQSEVTKKILLRNKYQCKHMHNMDISWTYWYDNR